MKEATIKLEGSGFRVTWYEHGRRCRRFFTDQSKAKNLAAEINIRQINTLRSTHLVTTTLSQEQVTEAERAISKLTPRYTLTEATDFFLQHHLDSDFSISIHRARREFIEAREKEGLEDSTVHQYSMVISRLAERIGRETPIHEITTAMITDFLAACRARNGTDPATTKTWNNYRGDLANFFEWCTGQGWIGRNPAAEIPKKRATEKGIPQILTVEQARKLMAYLEDYHNGAFARHFSLALFAGIRPSPRGELGKLHRHPDQERLIDLDRGVVHIPPDVSKTDQKRQIKIRDNLRAWLQEYPGPIFPEYHQTRLQAIRKEFHLGHDILRHSFFSYHISAFRSVGDAAIEGGNSEAIIRRHYLNLATQREGEAFWRIYPRSRQPSESEPESDPDKE